LKILLAVPDRDLLLCLGKLLRLRGDEVDEAFDGVQAISHISKSTDVAVLDGAMPRVDTKTIIKFLTENGIPSVVLSESPTTSRLLQQDDPASSYLPYPFSPGELYEKIRSVREKASLCETFSAGGLKVDAGSLLINGKIRITSEECDILKALSSSGVYGADGADVYVDSLNRKLIRSGSGARIKYAGGKGYRLVACDE